MTIKELYEWAQANDCTDYNIVVECYAKYGYTSDVYPKKSMLEKHYYDVAFKCRGNVNGYIGEVKGE